MIVVDKRERRSIVPRQLESMGCDVEYKILEVGDYIIGDVCIERKEINDYLSSLFNGRLERELYHMSKIYKKTYLITEGSITEAMLHRKINRRQYFSSLAKFTNRGDVSIITFETPYDTAYFIKSLNESVKNPQPLIPKIKISQFSDGDEVTYIVSAIPGIGMKKATNLLKKFKTLKNLVNSKPEDIAKVNGFGKKTANKLYELFNKEIVR